MNLAGLSLRGQDLSEGDFSGADLRGTDFTGACLVQVSFGGAQCGLLPRWRLAAAGWALSLGLLSGFLSAQTSALLVVSQPVVQSGGWMSLAILIFFSVVAQQGGLLRGVITTLTLLTGLGIVLGVASIGLDLTGMGYATLSGVQHSVLMISVICAQCLFFAIAHTMLGKAGLLALLGAIAGVLSIPLLAVGPIAEALDIRGSVIALVLAVAMVQFYRYVAKQALAGKAKHAFIKSLTVAVLSKMGTRFWQADLTGADFSEAQLRYTDLRAQGMDYVRWDAAKGLGLARWGAWPMSSLAVRQLMRTRRGHGSWEDGHSLVGANLMGMDLSDVDFRQADLTGASLIRAKLCRADFTDSNLKLVQALGSDFTQAKMTGSCIEGWAVNGQTCLDDVDCAFLYRVARKTPEESDRDRQPSSGEFAPGDFTRLFQVVLNTIELIFRTGIDQEALNIALSRIQADYNDGIKLQGVEEKGDGFLKVTLGVPEGIDKAILHNDFKQLYQEQLKHIERRYQAHLQMAYQHIDHHQATISELTTALKQLSGSQPQALARPEDMQQSQPDYSRVILTFWDGSLEQGYPVTADIHVGAVPCKFHASLPPAPELIVHYRHWRSLYWQTFGMCSRIQIENPSARTNVSRQELEILAERLANNLHDWLQSSHFRLVADKLREKLSPDQEVQIIIQTEDVDLRRLPWHLWQFLNDYPKAEVTLSGMSLEATTTTTHYGFLKKQARVLAVLGNHTGINVDVDQQLLQKLDNSLVDVVFLKEPSRQVFHESLWDPQGWDILYFSGHSHSQPDGQSGVIQLNPSDQISIKDLRFAMKKAVNQGLQLAVYNSCDGLGLASALCALKLPQVVVMKEPVPDVVAHSFLDYFLQSLTQGATFYTAFRDARQQLSELENRYPYASWLPTLFQTTTLVQKPQLSAWE